MHSNESIVSRNSNPWDTPLPYGNISWAGVPSSSSKLTHDDESPLNSEAATSEKPVMAGKELVRQLPKSRAWSESFWQSQVLFDPIIDGVHMFCVLFDQRSLSHFLVTEQIQTTSQFVKSVVNRLFSLARHMDIEPGMTNEFSDGLEEVIQKYGEQALGEIQSLILGEEIPFTIAGETLRYIGNIESTRFATERRELLEACLRESRFMLVRDGAAAGLSYIEDSRSVPALQHAIEQESHTDLKNDLIEVLSLLQSVPTE